MRIHLLAGSHEAIPKTGQNRTTIRSFPTSHGGLFNLSGTRTRPLLFQGVGCANLPISMRFAAEGTRVQFTGFLDRCATSTTGHAEYLFLREFLGLHDCMMEGYTTGSCSILLMFNN
jgi:hypothetical protein